MDPQATLDLIRQYLASDTDEARYLLSCYWEWRGKGGFQPENGDTIAEGFAQQLGEKACQST